MRIKLHGTRGSYPTSSTDHQRLGGNTSCIEIIDGEERLILDAGTGILGINFDEDYPNARIDILLTHLHMDHIQGLGFCKPIFDPEKQVHIWGPGGSPQSLQARLNRFLSPPLFPIPLRDIPSALSVHELPNTPFKVGKFTITAGFISHPGPTVGFRITSGTKSITYMPDHEPMVGRQPLYPEDSWVSGFGLAFKTDLLIHDSQYTQEEYWEKIGWGHCSLDIAVEYSARVQAKKLILFHHDPTHPDTKTTQLYLDYLKQNKPDFPIELAVQGQEIAV